MSAEVEATVQTRAAVTCYRRAGRGAPVLLLAAPGSAAASLFAPLAERCRVVHPELPARCEAEWLPELIEALGIDRPVIVAEARFEESLCEAGQRDSGRLGPIVLVPDSPADVGPFIDAVVARTRDFES